MASRIAALQAKLGGGAMIMGGMRPGGRPPVKKKPQKQRRASLDNSALLDRTVVKKGNRKRKKINVDFNELEDDEKANEAFAQSVSSDINMNKTKPISSSSSSSTTDNNNNTTSPSASTTSPSSGKKRFGGMGGFNMNAMMAGSKSPFKRKSGKSNNNDSQKEPSSPQPKGRDRGQSRSFSKGVTTQPLIDPAELNQNQPSSPNASSTSPAVSSYKPPGGGMGGMGGMMAMNAQMLNRSALKKANKGGAASTEKKEEEEKILEIVSKKHGKRHVRLFASLDKYMSYEKGENGKGLRIASFMENKYGKAMQEKGLKVGWTLTKIAKQDATKMSLLIIKNQLNTQAQMNGAKGYNITFEGAYEKNGGAEDAQPEPQQHVIPMSAPLQPVANMQATEQMSPMQEPLAPKQEPNAMPLEAAKTDKLKSELVKEELGLKVVRLFDAYDKYFVGVKGDDGKGVVVEGFVDDDFEDYGIGIGWKLQKLGKRNVIKTSFLMLKNQLTAQASTAKKAGYELTFIDESVTNSASQPNSPAQSASNSNTDNIPMTAPLNPVSAPMEIATAIDISVSAKSDDQKDKDPAPAVAEKKEPKPKLNRIPSTDNKPNFRPSLNKEQIDRFKPPSNKKGPLPPGPGGAASNDNSQPPPAQEKSESDAQQQNNQPQPTTEEVAKEEAPKQEQTEKQEFKIVPKKKAAEKAKGGYEAPKSCELIADIDASKKKMKLYQEFNKFFTAKGGAGNKGFVVDAMKNNEFGNALKELGIDSGWKITECAGKPLGNKMFAMLKNQISAAAKKNPKQGYEIVFENPNAAPSSSSEPADTASKAEVTAPSIAAAYKIEPKKKPEPDPKPEPEPEPKSEPETKPEADAKPPAEEAATNALPVQPAQNVKAEPVMPSLATASKISTTDTSNAHSTNNTTTAAKADAVVDDEAAEKKKFGKKRKSSFEAPKSCELIEEVSANKKKVKMYQEFTKFFTAKGGAGNKGFVVDSMKGNEFGKALKDLGIDSGWKITECAGKPLGNKMFAMLKNQISAAAKKNPKQGYEVVFENASGSASPTKKTAAAKPSTPRMNFKDDEKEEAPQKKAPSRSSPRAGWKITECAGKPLGNKMFAMLKNQISAAAKKNPKQGYEVVFENASGSASPTKKTAAAKPSTPRMNFKDDEKEEAPQKKAPSSPRSPKSPRASRGSSSRVKVEMVADGEKEKTLRIYHNLDKFVKATAVKGPKGFKVTEFSGMFGNDMKEMGVEIGWRLTKLCQKDVSKQFFQTIKTNSQLEFKNSNNKGYEVTFCAPE
eukprot:CAMPEP_0197077412 /NCGR_PEP_ID=MMETSP1384-20130603/212607_1 /TAXON_ID=29189 /ORGANISM="Ammonia sp." /LENGTH=1280 /DNA_ID=CAMNT_0042516279 /DNA_START=629 /DNA_END=4471 /DNA_ORIENTATION=+